MALSFLLALQTAAAPAPAPQAVAPIDFDLADVRSSGQDGPDLRLSRRCSPADPDEILVCGVRRDDDAYPLEEMERLFAPGRIVAETSLGGGVTGRVYLDQQVLDRGQVSNRVMFGIRMPF